MLPNIRTFTLLTSKRNINRLSSSLKTRLYFIPCCPRQKFILMPATKVWGHICVFLGARGLSHCLSQSCKKKQDNYRFFNHEFLTVMWVLSKFMIFMLSKHGYFTIPSLLWQYEYFLLHDEHRLASHDAKQFYRYSVAISIIARPEVKTVSYQFLFRVSVISKYSVHFFSLLILLLIDKVKYCIWTYTIFISICLLIYAALTLVYQYINMMIVKHTSRTRREKSILLSYAHVILYFSYVITDQQ